MGTRSRHRAASFVFLLFPLLAPLTGCATWDDIDQMSQLLNQRLDHLSGNVKTIQAQLDSQGKRQSEMAKTIDTIKGTLERELKDVRVELRALNVDSIQELMGRQVREALAPFNGRLEELPRLVGDVRRDVQSLTQGLLRAYRQEEGELQRRLGLVGQVVRDLEGPRTRNIGTQEAVEPAPRHEERLSRTDK